MTTRDPNDSGSDDLWNAWGTAADTQIAAEASYSSDTQSFSSTFDTFGSSDMSSDSFSDWSSSSSTDW